MLFVVDGVKLGKLTKIQQLNECSFEEFSPNCERNFEHQRNPQQRIKIENESKEYHSNTTIWFDIFHLDWLVFGIFATNLMMLAALHLKHW